MNTIITILRSINTMKKIIVLLVFLPFTTTGQDCACKTDLIEDYLPNPQYDRTEFQLNAIIESLQLFNKQTIENTFDEWISQNHKFYTPSIVINSTNITFTKFIADEDIVPISNLSYAQVYLPRKRLGLGFGREPKMMQVDGTAEFVRSGNQSSCQTAFNFTFELDDYFILFQKINDSMTENEEVNLDSGTKFQKINLTKIESNEKSCKNINEKHHLQFTYDNILQAIKFAMIERIKLIKKSVFQSILNKWIHPDNNSYARGENDYSRFKLHSNVGTFPGLYDYNEFVINGLNNFENVVILYPPNGKTTYELGLNNVKIRWNTALVKITQLSFDIRKFNMQGSLNKLILMEDLTLLLDEILEVSNLDYTLVTDNKLKDMLPILIVNGIKQTIQKIRYDNTKEFVNVIDKILRPFEEKSFQKSLVDLETEEKKFPLGSISILKLDIEAFHLKNITWLDFDKIEVGGTLSYEKIKGQANIFLPIVNDKVRSVPVSVDLFIKEATIRISLNKNDVQISVHWSDVDTTIMITSNTYNLSQQERTEIGKQIFQYFIKIMENQINRAIKSTFHPIFDIYKNSNNLNNQWRCFAIIYDYWSDMVNSVSTQAVEIIIKGSWNFSTINVHYENGKLLISGLQLKNGMASIKQLKNLDKPVTTTSTTRTDYYINNFSLAINHMENDITVNISLYDQNATSIVKKLESIVANFIGYLIYGNLTKDSNYHAKLGKRISEIITKAIMEDMKSINDDASLQIATNFVHILQDREYNLLQFTPQKADLRPFYSNSEYISKETKNRVKPFNATPSFPVDDFYFTFGEPQIQQETCFYYDDFVQVDICTEQKIHIQDPWNKISIFVASTVSTDYFMADTDVQEETKIYIDDKNIEVIYLDNASYPHPANETQKRELVLLTSSFLHSSLKVFPFSLNFCKPRSGSFEPLEKYFFSTHNIINYPLQLFSMYYIKLQIYGLRNKNKLRTVYSRTVTEFQLTIPNATATIIWNHYIGDYIKRWPKTMNLRISEFTLSAKITFTKRLLFTNQSRLLFSEERKSKVEKSLEEQVQLIVISAIQKAIKEEYNRINRN